MAKPLPEGIRHQIVGMNKAGRSIREISKALKVYRGTVHRILKRNQERNGDLSNKKGNGRPRSQVTRANKDILRKKVKREPKRSMHRLAKDMGMSMGSMSNLMKEIGLKSKQALVRHKISPGQEARRLERAKGLLKWKRRARNRNKDILWTDEKWFYVQSHVNKRNDRWILPVGCADDEVRIVKRKKAPSKVMIFALVASDGQSMPPIVFPSGVNINTKVYCNLVLSKVIPWIQERWEPGQAILQQNGAPAHTSKATQKLLMDQLGRDGFWSKKMWPPSR